MSEPQRQQQPPRKYRAKNKKQMGKDEVNITISDSHKKAVPNRKRNYDDAFAGRDTARSNLLRTTKRARTRNPQATRALFALCAPGLARGYRYGGADSTQPTASACPKQRITVGFPAGASLSGRPFVATESMAIAKRNPLAAIIAYDANSGNQTFTYQWTGSYTDATHTKLVGPTMTYFLPATSSTPISLVTATPTTTYAPHGQLVFAGADNVSTRRYFFCNAPDTVAFALKNNTASTLTVNVNVWVIQEETGPRFLGSATSGSLAASGVYNYSAIPLAGYGDTPGEYISYELEVTNTGVQASNYQVQVSAFTVTSNSYCFCHLPNPGLLDAIGVVKGVRINGMTMEFSNRASTLGLQGSCYGVQYAGSKPWQSIVGDLDGIAQAVDSVESPAATGLYGYAKTIDRNDFRMMEYFRVEGGVVYDSFWPIVTDRDYLVIYVKINNTADAQNGFWTFQNSIEIRTESQMFDVSVAPYDSSMEELARSELAYMDQWFENPLHLRDIINGVRKLVGDVANKVVKYGPSLLKAANEYGPSILQGAATLGALL